MTIREVEDTWRTLAGRRSALVRAFYERLFERHPGYRPLFPADLDSQMEKMVEMFTTVARFADRIDLVRPYLLEVGRAHRRMHLEAQDLRNFRDVFIAALTEIGLEDWSEERANAWRAAFDDVIVPIVEEGMGV